MRVRFPSFGFLVALFVLAVTLHPLLGQSPQQPGCQKTPCVPEIATCPACSGAKPIKLITKVYSVADLVIPVGRQQPGRAGAVVKACCQDGSRDCAASCSACAKSGTEERKTASSANEKTTAIMSGTDEKRLIDLIVNSVRPTTWNKKGGPGTIDYFPLTFSLTVTQTAEIHGQIAELLSALRHEQDTEVALEVRLVSVPESSIGTLSSQWADAKKSDCGAKKACFGSSSFDKAAPVVDQKIKVLNDGEVSKMMEALQPDARTNILQTPKLTVFNGQEAAIQVGDEQSFVTGVTIKLENGNLAFHPQSELIKTGIEIAAQPVVSADRQFVRVKLKANLTSLDDPKPDHIKIETSASPLTQLIQNPKVTKLSVDKTLALPDGGTGLIFVGKKLYQAKEKVVPVLSKIPYMNQLLCNTSPDNDCGHEVILMMVTPRIIVLNQEAEVDSTSRACSDGQFSKASMPEAEGEEQEMLPKAQATTIETAKTARGPISMAAKLVKQYHKACAEGDAAKATEFAVKALAIDPLCFGKKPGVAGKK